MSRDARQPTATPAESSAIDGVLDLGVSPAPPTRALELPSGRRIDIEPGESGERLTVTGKGGRVELTILLTDSGPKLCFESADLELKANGAVTVDCERFAVRARSEASVEAPSTRIEATLGDLDLKANDHVVVVGEEIRLNCDKPEVVPDWLARTLGARVAERPPKRVAPQEVTGDSEFLAEMERTRDAKDRAW